MYISLSKDMYQGKCWINIFVVRGWPTLCWYTAISHILLIHCCWQIYFLTNQWEMAWHLFFSGTEREVKEKVMEGWGMMEGGVGQKCFLDISKLLDCSHLSSTEFGIQLNLAIISTRECLIQLNRENSSSNIYMSLLRVMMKTTCSRLIAGHVLLTALPEHECLRLQLKYSPDVE